MINRDRDGPSLILNLASDASIHPDRLIDEQPVLLHLLVERRAVDVEDAGGFLAVPVQGLKRLDDDPLFGFLERFLQGRMFIGSARPRGLPGNRSRGDGRGSARDGRR